MSTINDEIRTKLISVANSKSAAASNALNLQTTDWMTLLVAQLRNQDMYNTADTSEYTSQMAQYSMIQALNDLTALNEEMYATNYTSYAASLVGKEVTVAKLDGSNNLVTETGTVTGVTLYENEPMVYIGKNAYKLSQIMVLGAVEDSTPPDDTETEPPADGDESDDDTP
ncbi:flagellar hook assembly protein FlgD [Clostridium aminobutyricum]|uniref:Flagellar hook capping protein n=1 Tax=Clostridium aminobutyricum TaxID=33953 RepID=A0A939D9R0_CLOAM|nr:flagellar hook capping FlgD N-terminal domain-containing protein [Clostridium aminobutyricum]MBN7773766.1 hypothetical protein [Clostridium aminobutyricum]